MIEEQNELDRIYSALRYSNGWSKARQASMHEAIRMLKRQGVEATTDPVCSNGDCGKPVQSWGQWCHECLKTKVKP